MNKEERKKITGGLSSPSKMPGYSYNLPAIHCKTGSKLAQIPGTTCHGCYALRTSTPAGPAGSDGMTPATSRA